MPTSGPAAADPGGQADAAEGASRGRPRLACERCFRGRKRCVWPDDPARPCDRCDRLGHKCEPRDAGNPARGRESGSGTLSAGSAADARTEASARESGSASPGPALPSGDLLAREDILFACISIYWETTHVPVPVVHRATFEAAFLRGASDVYGPHKPAALLCMLAAHGATFASLPGLSRDAHQTLACLYADRARDLLAAGRHGPGPPTVSDVEYAQVLVLLVRHYVSQGGPTEAAALRDQSSDLLDGVLRRATGPDGTPFGGSFAPTDPAEWVRSEIFMRCAVTAGHSDANTAAVLQRRAGTARFDYYSGRVPMPCHDIYFELPSAEDAFRILSSRDHPRSVANPAPFLAPEPNFALCAALARHLVSSLFSLRAGRLVLPYLFDLLTGLQTRARAAAAREGIDPLALASQPPELDTPTEAAQRRRTELAARLAGEILRAFPSPAGDALAEGDPAPLFSIAETHLGGEPAVHAVCSMAAGFHTLAISAWVQGDPSSASPAFFSSAPLAAALEGGIAAARVMAFQLARSPGSVPGRCHQTAFLAAVRTLTLQAAVARAGGAERVAEDAGAAMAYATAFAEAYPAGRKPVRDLLALFATAGLDLARGGSSPAARAVPDVLPPGAHGDAAVEELTRRFAATVMVSEELLGRVVGRAGEGDEAGGP